MKIRMSFTHKKRIAQSAVALSFLCLIIGGTIGTLAMIGVPAVLWLFSEFHRGQNLKAVQRALPMLDGIFDGRQYVGKNAVLVESRWLDDLNEDPLVIEQLCKTENGHWFHFRFSTKNGSGVPYGFEVAACDESQAKRWLEKSPDVYRRIFGEPRIA